MKMFHGVDGVHIGKVITRSAFLALRDSTNLQMVTMGALNALKERIQALQRQVRVNCVKKENIRALSDQRFV